MSDSLNAQAKGSRRSRRDGGDRPHNPLCLWRYLAAYGVVAIIWILVVYRMAVVDQVRAKYGSTLLYLSMGFAVFAYLAEESYVWWKERCGTATTGDFTDPTTKKWILAAVVIVGGCLNFGMTRAMVKSAGVWTQERGMQPADTPPAGGGGPGVVVPPRGPFDPTLARPLPAVPPAASGLPGLLAYWSFDENGGAKAADAGGAGLHAKLGGGRWVPGARGSAFWITGADSAGQIGEGPALNFPARGPFTFTGWIRTASDGIVLALRDSRDPGAVVMLSVENGRLFYLVREDRMEHGGPAQVTGPVVADGNWHHFAATRNADGEIEVFVDGASAGKHRAGASGGPITTDLRFVGREEYRIRVAFRGATTWNGVIDELAVFGRQLTAEEVARLAGRR